MFSFSVRSIDFVQILRLHLKFFTSQVWPYEMWCTTSKICENIFNSRALFHRKYFAKEWATEQNKVLFCEDSAEVDVNLPTRHAKVSVENSICQKQCKKNISISPSGIFWTLINLVMKWVQVQLRKNYSYLQTSGITLEEFVAALIMLSLQCVVCMSVWNEIRLTVGQFLNIKKIGFIQLW